MKTGDGHHVLLLCLAITREFYLDSNKQPNAVGHENNVRRGGVEFLLLAHVPIK
jgi:hypothetical protein